MTRMLEEIHAQPDILRAMCAHQATGVASLAAEIKQRGVEGLCIAARGTSDNAATYAKYIFEIMNSMVVALAAPSVAMTYRSPLNLKRHLYIGISQSGESPDVVASVEQAGESGALTAGVTNEPGSKLTRVADHVLYCCCGREESVAATKTYTATLGLIYLLSTAVGTGSPDAAGLGKVSDVIDWVFGLEDDIARIVERYRYMNECLVIARGINQATCQEAALKMAETCYVIATPYSGADVKHGPMAMVEKGMPVFVYAPSGKTEGYMLQLVREFGASGAEVIAISDVDAVLAEARTPIRLDFHMDEMLSPLVYIVVGQLFAQYLSITKGLDPDQPRNLAKITRTL